MVLRSGGRRRRTWEGESVKLQEMIRERERKCVWGEREVRGKILTLVPTQCSSGLRDSVEREGGTGEGPDLRRPTPHFVKGS